MFDVSFESNGRRVNPSQFGNELEKLILQQVEQSISNHSSSSPAFGSRSSPLPRVPFSESVDLLRGVMMRCEGQPS